MSEPENDSLQTLIGCARVVAQNFCDLSALQVNSDAICIKNTPRRVFGYLPFACCLGREGATPLFSLMAVTRVAARRTTSA